MINSLRTGVTGLRSHQTRMDVIGNNIANVNTVGFKRSRVTFHEVLAELKLGVGRMAGGRGVNPAYVGRGVQVGSIDQDWSQGSLEHTNRPEDLALVGDGFFIVSDGSGNLLTRAGDFSIDANGYLVTTGGLRVKGWSIDPNTGMIDMSQLQDVQIDLITQAPTVPRYTTSLVMGGNLDADNTTDPVTISTVFYDELGRAHNVVIDFQQTGNPNEWSYTITPDDPALFDTSTYPLSGTITFNPDGSIATPTINLQWDAQFVSSGDVITIDLGQLTQYSGSTTVGVNDHNGYTAGRFLGFGIDPEGKVILNYSNGETVEVFQLAIGNVPNPNGLEQQGDNLYGLSIASGDLVLGRAGTEFETSVVSGALEGSNVDLAVEFTDMIVTQRGYQAAARVITTSDELLQEIVQLKR